MNRREKKVKLSYRFDGNQLRSFRSKINYILSNISYVSLENDDIVQIFECVHSLYEDRKPGEQLVVNWTHATGEEEKIILDRYYTSRTNIDDPMLVLKGLWKKIMQRDKTLVVDLDLHDRSIALHLYDQSGNERNDGKNLFKARKYVITGSDGACYIYDDRTAIWKLGNKMDLCGFIGNFFADDEKYYKFSDPKDLERFKSKVRDTTHLKKIADACCMMAKDSEFEKELDLSEALPIENGEFITLRDLKVHQRDQSCKWSFELSCGVLNRKIDIFREEHDIKLMYDDVKMDKIYEELFPNCHKYFCGILKDIPKRRFLMLRLGLAITTSMKDRAIYLLWGHGMGGKSMVFMSILKILGKLAVSASKFIIIKGSSKQMANAHGTHNMQCKDKRLIWVNETGKGDAFDDSALKSWVSGDVKSDRDILKAQTTYIPRGKIFVTTNVVPTFNTHDSALQDRIKGVNMNVRYWSAETELKPKNWESEEYKDFFDEEANIHWVKITKESQAFVEKFHSGFWKAELLTMLCCLAYECFAFFEQSEDGVLPVPEIISKETKYLISSGDVVQNFLDDCCEIVDHHHDGDCIDTVSTYFNTYLSLLNQKIWQRKTLSEILRSRLLYHETWRTSIGQHTKIKVTNPPKIIVSRPAYG